MKEYPSQIQCFAVALLLCATTHGIRLFGQEYHALLRDGTTVAGDQLRHQTERRPITLDDRQLLDVDNPVWVLRAPKRTVAQPRTYIEFTNGDRLVGRAHAIVTGEAALPWADHLVVTDTLHTGGLVRVRMDWIRRIVRGHVNEASPGDTRFFIRLDDGREVTPRSLQWRASGARLLTDDGIVDVAFDRMVDFRFPLEHIVPPLPGAVFLEGDQPKIVRTVTTDGEVFTFPHSMLARAEYRKGRSYIESPELLATRPPWSLDTISFARDGIAWQTYLNDDEMPLSLLPLVKEESAAGVLHLPWRRNANVYGGMLRRGETASELGIGMHSHSKLTFALPSGASTFQSLLALDQAAGTGGCVHCRIYLNEDDQPIWQREFLQGRDGIQRIGPLEIRDAKTLTLEVDFADDERPEGADPLDIRDWVHWLLPTIQVDPQSPSFASRRQEDIERLVPEVEGWRVADDLLDHVTVRPSWHERGEGWRMALCSGKRPLVIERHLHVNLTNAWLHIEAAAADMPGALHEIRVQADSDDVGSTMNGRIRTMDKGRFHDRVHILWRHPHEEVTLRVTATPEEGSSRKELKGVVFRPLRLQPLIKGLPSGGTPIEPEVPITVLSPLKAICDGEPLSLRAGMVSERVELNVRGWNFSEGYGVPTDSEITYELDPSWKRFVAVIGLADGWKGAGPYQILIDGKVFWSSGHHYNRNRQGEQIDVELPPGGETITLKMLGDSSGGAWAHAGFLTK